MFFIPLLLLLLLVLLLLLLLLLLTLPLAESGDAGLDVLSSMSRPSARRFVSGDLLLVYSRTPLPDNLGACLSFS